MASEVVAKVITLTIKIWATGTRYFNMTWYRKYIILLINDYVVIVVSSVVVIEVM